MYQGLYLPFTHPSAGNCSFNMSYWSAVHWGGNFAIAGNGETFTLLVPVLLEPTTTVFLSFLVDRFHLPSTDMLGLFFNMVPPSFKENLGDDETAVNSLLWLLLVLTQGWNVTNRDIWAKPTPTQTTKRAPIIVQTLPNTIVPCRPSFRNFSRCRRPCSVLERFTCLVSRYLVCSWHNK